MENWIHFELYICLFKKIQYILLIILKIESFINYFYLFKFKYFLFLFFSYYNIISID
jgi:hypothetical protein